MVDISFEGNDIVNGGNAPVTDDKANAVNKDDVVDISTNKTDDINDQTGDNTTANTTANNADDNNGLEVGTVINFDGQDYTVAENGDIVDKDGNIFKEAKDVKAWIDENQVADGNEDFSVDNVIKALGYEIKDDKGNLVEFDNNVEGLKAYVDSVIELQSNDIRQGTINKFYQDNPLVKQFVDYVQLTGTPRGFGELPDRTGIQVVQDNRDQQIAIIKMAAQEFGNKTLNDNYIKYLESTGTLYDEAKSQLEALQAKDVQLRKQIETEAAQAREQDRLEVENYFKKVNEVITSRKLGEYTLPENVTIQRNGTKVTLTLNDFYDFVSKPVKGDDGQIMTQYSRALENQSNEDLLNKELLDAWLIFTGGSYKDLVNMIAKEDNVRRIMIKSKDNKAKHQMKISKPKSKVSADDIVFN